MFHLLAFCVCGVYTERGFCSFQPNHPPADVPQFLGRLLISSFGHQLLLFAVGEALPRHALHFRGASEIERSLGSFQGTLEKEKRGEVEQRLGQQGDVDVAAESGPHDARGESVDRDPRALQPASQLQREQQVGQLALTVAERLAVVLFTVQVVEVDVAVLVELRGDHDDAAGSGGLQPVQQEVSEEEVTQVVHAELHLKAVLRLGVGALVDARIVDEHVDLGFLLNGRECIFTLAFQYLNLS